MSKAALVSIDRKRIALYIDSTLKYLVLRVKLRKGMVVYLYEKGTYGGRKAVVAEATVEQIYPIDSHVNRRFTTVYHHRLKKVKEYSKPKPLSGFRKYGAIQRADLYNLCRYCDLGRPDNRCDKTNCNKAYNNLKRDIAGVKEAPRPITYVEKRNLK